MIGLQRSFQVDLAFACFTNLTELDLGRNRLQSLGNLPEGLVTLSCAANELSGMSRPELCIDEQRNICTVRMKGLKIPLAPGLKFHYDIIGRYDEAR